MIEEIENITLNENSILSGKCKCTKEPKGENGLEGYCINEIFDYEEKNGIYRIYPDKEFTPTYYETCGKNTFLKFFSPYIS